jgi:hypothetical protein
MKMRRNREAPQDVVDELREKIGLAFKDLRKANLICRKSVSYEGSAAACMMDDFAEKAVREGKTVNGTVFYTGEDNKMMIEKHGQIVISFGGDHELMRSVRHPEMVEEEHEGFSCESVGWMIKFALEKHGLVTEWNGCWAYGISAWLPRYPPK